MKKVFLLFVSLIAVALSAPAEAHSTLAKSEPADGAKLSVAPNEIRIWFSEPIKVTLSTFQVRDATGSRSIFGVKLVELAQSRSPSPSIKE